MDKPPVLHLRVEASIIKSIDNIARRAGINRSEAVRQLLREILKARGEKVGA